MTEHDAFLANIREHPDDDTPRLMYADWLTERGDPRGEFIRTQCEVARLDAEDPRRPALVTRANGLLRKHSRAWRAALPRLRGVRWGAFERGFIGSVAASVRALLDALPTILDAAPTAEIRISATASGQLKKLFASPHAPRIRALAVEPSLAEPVSAAEVAESPHTAGLRSLSFVRTGDGTLGAEALAASPHLTGLRRLTLDSCNLDDQAALALAESTRLVSLCRLDLFDNRIGPRGVRGLAATTRFRLKELNLSANPIGDDGMRALAEGAGLTELTRLTLVGCGLGNCDALLATSQLPRLACLDLDVYAPAAPWRGEVFKAAPRGTALRRLGLSGSALTSEAVRKLARCPRLADLHELILWGAGLRDAGTTALAASPFLADLRVLNLRFNRIGDEGAVALARGGWRRLEVVDLSANEIRDAGVKALLASPLGKHTSVLNLRWNKYRKAGREALRRRRVRAWPTTEEPS